MGVCGDRVEVTNAQQLIDLFNSTTETTLTTDIVLLADLDFSGFNLTLPLGAFSNGTCVTFSGVFHGNSHTIKGLVIISNLTEWYVHAGLFCSLKDVIVENLVIDSSCFFSGYSAGALGVSVTGSLTVTNVTNKAAVNGTRRVGGFIGFVEQNQQGIKLAFEDCVNDGIVTVNKYEVGGFIGEVVANTNITMAISHSINNGNVTGSIRDVGGFFLGALTVTKT